MKKKQVMKPYSLRTCYIWRIVTVVVYYKMQQLLYQSTLGKLTELQYNSSINDNKVSSRTSQSHFLQRCVILSTTLCTEKGTQISIFCNIFYKTNAILMKFRT